ncbi:O-methyltransferase involved in polyketide biosynthesis [Fluviicoccus keumensis]|uniref:O-methyltransferase involved in polyketide biosynthesis n=1 Tax=Fluviicoccus keumensis TaxID=1435465 RepID=A0A4Q7YIK3_9GAMM|nr:class I SAM-dependent methyltransferase [Fluviicoccus keumensis]RZU37050.1 O-methyltransferase involved in polyketide biosynthesis [Fluviicoccus keumensis]
MKEDQDTSSISFTAHYTGFVWYRFGLSHPAFATRQGCAYFQFLRPFEVAARKVIGSDIKTTLLQRHHLIDHELEQLIGKYPDIQIVELACGLSPRGWRFHRDHPSITYVEADLQEMAARKQALLRELHSLDERHTVQVCNILIQDAPESLESLLKRELDPARPVVVITEGLVNYFRLEEISGFWSRLAKVLQDFPMGFYLTDIYPQVTRHRFFHWIQMANKTLKLSSRSNFTMHFEQPEEAQSCLQHCGFDTVTVFNPDETPGDRLPKADGGSLVWVIRSEI